MTQRMSVELDSLDIRPVQEVKMDVQGTKLFVFFMINARHKELRCVVVFFHPSIVFFKG